MEELLQMVFDRDGSDLHIAANVPPIIRINGKLTKTDYEPLTGEDTQRLIFSILTNEQRKQLEQTYELDCSYGVVGLGRFRVNSFKSKGNYAAVLRTINSKAPKMEDLNMPPIVNELTHKPRGMVLVTGPTGSGKSTTLAAMIDHLNTTRSLNIISLEDPIEFVHPSKRSQVVQRELGTHISSFADGVRDSLREDPDVILVGELRDAETISMAMTAAETGHLVLGTLHTTSAVKSVDRIIDALPSDQREQTKSFLSHSLHAVVTQNLVKTPDGRQRRAIVEIMVMNRAIAKLITTEQTHQIPAQLLTGKSQGMQQMDQALLDAISAK
ncbi:MAG: type IV pilus twitching motility protein PilT, partial [Candidatus Sericytochromatia bacterium]|nr:type IV pilus twitching motility protein PilT [Candidatus Sericytochromatia bacterium]